MTEQPSAEALLSVYRAALAYRDAIIVGMEVGQAHEMLLFAIEASRQPSAILPLPMELARYIGEQQQAAPEDSLPGDQCPSCYWHPGHEPAEWFAEEAKIRGYSAPADEQPAPVWQPKVKKVAEGMFCNCGLSDIKDCKHGDKCKAEPAIYYDTMAAERPAPIPTYGPDAVGSGPSLHPAPSALASTGEQSDFARCLRCVSHELTRDVCGYAGRCVRQATASPSPTIAADYTPATAGGIVGCWEDKWEIDASNVPEGALDDLELEVRRALSAERPRDLFVAGEFTAHSGDTLPYKIECDAMTDGDIAALAVEARRRLPRFATVYGVPRGGVRFAAALDLYATRSPLDPILIVDDVLTTGRSMEEARRHLGPNVIGVVIFARGPCPDWVTPLFSAAVASERDAALHAAPSPSVVDYTERARKIAAEYRADIGAVYPTPYLERLIADALSASASEHKAAAIRAFGQRVWSDTEEVAYQAGVSDTRARLQEPDVREAVARAIARSQK